jgi:hypothetical protein
MCLRQININKRKPEEWLGKRYQQTLSNDETVTDSSTPSTVTIASQASRYVFPFVAGQVPSTVSIRLDDCPDHDLMVEKVLSAFFSWREKVAVIFDVPTIPVTLPEQDAVPDVKFKRNVMELVLVHLNVVIGVDSATADMGRTVTTKNTARRMLSVFDTDRMIKPLSLIDLYP